MIPLGTDPFGTLLAASLLGGAVSFLHPQYLGFGETTLRGYSAPLRTLNVELLLIVPTGRTFVKHAPFLTGSSTALHSRPFTDAHQTPSTAPANRNLVQKEKDLIVLYFFSIKCLLESLGKRKFAVEIFQGGAQFPDRRYSPRAKRPNRCNYGTDSIVWMEEKL